MNFFKKRKIFQPPILSRKLTKVRHVKKYKSEVAFMSMILTKNWKKDLILKGNGSRDFFLVSKIEGNVCI